MLAAEAEAYEGATGRAFYRRLENDLSHIRRHLDVDLYFDRHTRGYDFRDLWVPLLDLPDEDLETIAWLERIFDLDSPRAPACRGRPAMIQSNWRELRGYAPGCDPGGRRPQPLTTSLRPPAWPRCGGCFASDNLALDKLGLKANDVGCRH